MSLSFEIRGEGHVGPPAERMKKGLSRGELRTDWGQIVASGH